MTWVKAAFGLIAIINWVMSRLDQNEKAQVMAALWEAEFMKADKEAIDRANRARDDVERRLRDDPGGLRAPNPDSRT